MTDRSPAEMGEPQDVFPFVVGCARSGTTLLRAMLDSHPALAIPPESYFVATFARRRHRFGPGGGFDREAFVEALCSDRWFRGWGVDDALVRTAIARERPMDAAHAIRVVYGVYASSRGKPRYGDKTPTYVFSMRSIGSVLPESRFVHLIRDGRDVAGSLVSSGMRFAPTDIGRALLFWERRVVAGRRQGRKLGMHRYREVRYEDLIEDPEATLRGLSAFLELEYQPDMLRYHERVDEVLSGVPGQQHHRHLAQAPVKGLRDWRRDLSSV